METINFLITGVGGQGIVLASEVVGAVGLAAGYDVKKAEIRGVAQRMGAVLGHVRWGEKVQSPVVPEGRVDYLVAFEILEGLRYLNEVRPDGVILLNEQEIPPVSVTSGGATYPDRETVDAALRATSRHVFRVPALRMAQELGDARVVNAVLLGALSVMLPVEANVWEQALRNRVPPRFLDLNLNAYHGGRGWMTRQSGWDPRGPTGR